MNNHKVTYDNTLREIAELEARLGRLTALKTALEGLLGLTPSADHVKIPGDLPVPPRAPYGFLQKAVLDLFTDGQKLGNAEIRGGLKRARYPHIIDTTALRKTLQRLAKLGTLNVDYSTGRSIYCRPNKKG